MVPAPNLFKEEKGNFQRTIPLTFGFQAILNWLISIIDDVMAAIFYEKKREHCHGQSFDPIFLKYWT